MKVDLVQTGLERQRLGTQGPWRRGRLVGLPRAARVPPPSTPQDYFSAPPNRAPAEASFQGRERSSERRRDPG